MSTGTNVMAVARMSVASSGRRGGEGCGLAAGGAEVHGEAVEVVDPVEPDTAHPPHPPLVVAEQDAGPPLVPYTTCSTGGSAR